MDRLHYFTNVLGIREVMLPPAPASAGADPGVTSEAALLAASTAAEEGPKLATTLAGSAGAFGGTARSAAGHFAKLLVVDEPSAQPLARHPMFLKMMEAIGLVPTDLRVLEYRADELTRLGLSAEERALPVLSFSPALTQALAENPPARMQTTFGPRDLAKNEQLKRQTWTDLQAFAKKIGLAAKPRS